MTYWREGDWVVRREVLSNGPWLGTMVKIIVDSPEYLISFIPQGSPFEFPDGNWPIPGGKHPWSDRQCWHGHGCLMIQKPGCEHAVWHFWHGPDRAFSYWYVNLQEPYRRTEIGYDTQDLELDFIVYPDGTWEMKDEKLLAQRVQEGRWSKSRELEIRAEGERIASRLELGQRWWPTEWRNWTPDSNLSVPEKLPPGWETI